MRPARIDDLTELLLPSSGEARRRASSARARRCYIPAEDLYQKGLAIEGVAVESPRRDPTTATAGGEQHASA